jgi:hypothetical protein
MQQWAPESFNIFITIFAVLVELRVSTLKLSPQIAGVHDQQETVLLMLAFLMRRPSEFARCSSRES